MLDTLDTLDRRLLALLQANARETAANLARKLGIARTTIIARIARLETRGVIRGYGVRLGGPPADSGLRAYVGISVRPKSGAAVLRSLDRIVDIEELCAVSGEFDYLAMLRCESTARLDRVLDEMGGIDGVRQTKTSIVLTCKIDRRTPV